VVGGSAGGFVNEPRQNIWPKVTVIIVNWNGVCFLERCLSALLAQTVAPHENLRVILDGDSYRAPRPLPDAPKPSLAKGGKTTHS
jgi:hypothetical protein